MTSIYLLAQRSATDDEKKVPETTVRTWVDAGIVSVDSGADEKRELEIARALALYVDSWTPIEEVKGVGNSLRSALKHYDLQENRQHNDLTAEVIEAIEAARVGKAAFVKTVVIEKAGEPTTYQVCLLFGSDVSVLDQTAESIVRDRQVVPPNRVMQHKTINLTDALNYKPKAQSQWSGR